MKHIKKFNNHAEYDAAKSGLIKPSVSICKAEEHINYDGKPYIMAIFDIPQEKVGENVTICGVGMTGFSKIIIDSVVLPEVVSRYTFDTDGKHIIAYVLSNPKVVPVNAFFSCSYMTSVVIPNSVETIGNDAFAQCYDLSDISIPEGVKEIKNGAFAHTKIASITLPSTLTTLGSSLFNFGDSATSRMLESLTCLAQNAPTITYMTFQGSKYHGTLTVPVGSTGYDEWMRTGDYYLGKYGWTKVEI